MSRGWIFIWKYVLIIGVFIAVACFFITWSNNDYQAFVPSEIVHDQSGKYGIRVTDIYRAADSTMVTLDVFDYNEHPQFEPFKTKAISAATKPVQVNPNISISYPPRLRFTRTYELIAVDSSHLQEHRHDPHQAEIVLLFQPPHSEQVVIEASLLFHSCPNDCVSFPMVSTHTIKETPLGDSLSDDLQRAIISIPVRWTTWGMIMGVAPFCFMVILSVAQEIKRATIVFITTGWTDSARRDNVHASGPTIQHEEDDENAEEEEGSVKPPVDNQFKTPRVADTWDIQAIDVDLRSLRGQRDPLTHYVESVIDRHIMRQDEKTAAVRIGLLKKKVEELQLGKQYLEAIDDLQLHALEREIKRLKLEIEQQSLRDQHERQRELQSLQHQLQIAQLKKQIWELEHPAQQPRESSVEERRQQAAAKLQAEVNTAQAALADLRNERTAKLNDPALSEPDRRRIMNQYEPLIRTAEERVMKAEEKLRRWKFGSI